MTIADKITRLTAARNAIRTALGNKGVSASSHGFEDFATDIAAIPTSSSPNLQDKTVNITPSETAQSQTVTADNGYDGLDEVAVNVGAIASNYVGSGVARRSSSDLTASGGTVTAPAGYYSSNASKSVASGTAGTPVATKGSISNHAISITPSVTNTAGYISGGNKTGTPVSVTAAELASGNKEITSNGSNIDVVGYSTVSVAVPTGGGVQVGIATATPSSATSYINFTNLLGEPTSFVVVSSSNLTTGSPYKAASVVYDGTNTIGQIITNTSGSQMTYISGAYIASYNNNTLTITLSGGNFQPNEYKLVYTYGGSSANIATADVQVGSGATSITFPNLVGEPLYWSCIFKDDIGTSSGYTRAHIVVNNGTSIYGMEMGSGSTASSNWTASYNNGSLTITSNSTSAGGYFHQPGYYQLTYAISEAISIETEPLSVTENGTYTAPTGKAYTPVTVNVSGSGGKACQIDQTPGRAASSTYTDVGPSITVSKAGTYHVYWTGYRSSTSGTNGSQLYINGTAHGSAQTSFNSTYTNIQTVHLTNVSLSANDVLTIRARSRGNNYYMYILDLVIIEA